MRHILKRSLSHISDTPSYVIPSLISILTSYLFSSTFYPFRPFAHPFCLLLIINRVALRVRPLNNNKETLQNCNECLTIIPDAPQILIGTDKSFTFNYVFPSGTEQEKLFQGCVSPLTEKLVEG
jgi:hypothetical protein